MRGSSHQLRTPSLRRHKPSALGVVTLNGKDHYLGEWPACRKHPPDEVQRAYDRLIAEWLAAGRRTQASTDDARPESVSVNEVLLAFWNHAQTHYRHEDGSATSEIQNYRYSLKPLKEMYGHLPASEFSPLKLKAIRQKMIEADLCCTLINQRIGRIVRVFAWAVENEIVDETVYRSLAIVRGLQQGRTEAREPQPVKPVAASVVYATLPFVSPPIRAMIELQMHTGMRPGEACVLRGSDLDLSGDIWLYRPHRHKTKHKQKDRVIALGPKAQAVVKQFLQLNTETYLFSPREAMAQFRTEQRARRKSKVQPSQVDRRRRKPKKLPRERYDTRSFAQAIAKGVLAANKSAACDACKPLQPVDRCCECQAAALPHWHPHQLRHTHATEVRRRFGLEAAQVALGHSQAKVTEVYAERDATLAAKVAMQIG